MQQYRLFTPQVECKTFETELLNVSAVFKCIDDNLYEVLLQINSNKFLIRIQTAMNRIEKFEILAIKGFINLSLSTLRVLKNVIYKLYFEV